ncbi:DUF6210 family protein [Kitasatospora sp. NPDC051853]|uniref:DUF6210 family protein n=1 Tax=Kitasatospora sp. NPDC051853 TaxID=3364058 RepID=UPI00379FACBC
MVEAGTGVVHHQQYGGTTNRQGQVEGFLVPLHSPDQLACLRALFERDLRGGGAEGHRWTAEQRARLRSAVSAIRYWTSDGTDDHPHSLRLDDSRTAETDEAWVPVLTPDGPAVLLWSNSD